MKRIPMLLVFVFSTLGLYCQVTFILKGVPESTPREPSFYLATSINGWEPNSSQYKFTVNNEGILSLTIQPVPDTFEYKVCRGDWSSVEVDAKGADIPNRIYTSSLGQSVLLSVDNWRDRMNPKQLVSTASSSVFFTPTSIEIPQLDRRRTVRVYFPPNYSSRQGFPVIYMLDGQNVFDASTSFSGEWRVDETLDSLFQQKGFACIVVAIYHGDHERINEYTPWQNSLKQGGDGVKFARFIVKDLKPYIDKYYRTRPDRDNTVIMGSSLGGLMALYMALEYPETFGKAGVFSPSLWWSDKAFEHIDKFKKRSFQKIYLYGGEKEGQPLITDLQKAEEVMKRVGFSENELLKSISPYGRHNEYYWGLEFTKSITWLMGL